LTYSAPPKKAGAPPLREILSKQRIKSIKTVTHRVAVFSLFKPQRLDLSRKVQSGNTQSLELDEI
jgi:hypothetical protein